MPNGWGEDQMLQQRLARALQGRADRHNQSLPPEVRGSQTNQDLDHYLVGNEMAGPQYPLWQRLGAVLPAVGHEIARPFLSPENKGMPLSALIGPTGGDTRIGSSEQLMNLGNSIFGGKDEPTWIAKGEGAGGAAAEPSVGFGGALRNLKMLYRGATGGQLPEEEDPQRRVASLGWGK